MLANSAFSVRLSWSSVALIGVAIEWRAARAATATQNGSLYLGQQDRIGTLAPGKQADLVLIKGDPSKRIEEIENVETVFKAGIGFDSKKLIDSVRGQVGIR
jgi:cytosine/adenosine deaminase-related metal-dependent hydrolase